VAYRYTLHATHSGSWRGAPPTGKAISVTSIAIARLTDGKVAEGWQNADVLGLVQQLGLMPTPGQASS
jgi:predicted ester cyclase